MSKVHHLFHTTILYRRILFAGLTFFLALAVPSMAQTKEWMHFCSTDSNDFAEAVAVDGSGNVYVTGNAEGALNGQKNAGKSDICLIKYDGKGTKLWTRLHGTANSDGGMDVAVDVGGNIYVAGYAGDTLDGQIYEGRTDICLMKFDNNGTKLWTRLCGSPTQVTDQGMGVAVDEAGKNVYITGYTGGWLDTNHFRGGVFDICLIKYDSSGTRLWTRLCGTDSSDQGNDVAVDRSGNVYVTGYVRNAGIGKKDMTVVKYNSIGAMQWTKFLGTKDWDEAGNSLAVDAGGHSYIVGYTYGSLDDQTNKGETDMFLVKYTANGNKEWTRFYGTTNADRGDGVVLDATGNVYICGNTYGTIDGQTNSGRGDFYLMKCDSGGTEQWARLCGTDSSDNGRSVAVDVNGNIYIAGSTNGQNGYSDICLVKFALRTQVQPFAARLPQPLPRETNDNLMCDIFGRKIDNRVSCQPAGMYLVHSKSAALGKRKLLVH